MAKYKVKEKAFINGRLMKPGDTVDLDLPKEHSIPDHLELAEGSKQPDKGRQASKGAE